jgi:tetratricopeptide (TPR) repeat protein
MANCLAQSEALMRGRTLAEAKTQLLDLLEYVIANVQGPLLVIATARPELLRSRPGWGARARGELLELEPLSAEDAVRMLDELLAGGLPTELSTLVVDRAEGNPFFIGEILLTLEEKGFISLTTDGWTAADLTQVPVPPLVQQVIEGRLAHLDERSRELLGVASVVGQDVHLDIWRDASGASDEELSIAISSAADLHILEETNGTPALRFTHALVREALYHELGLPQRRSLHLAVGEALTRRPSPDPDAVAYHFHQARHEQALEWLMFAGERAQQFYAWRTAAERFESVLPFLESNPEYTGARGWLLYRTGLLLIYADPNRGIGHLREAERVAQIIGDRQLAAYASADRGLLRCLIGDVRRGLSEMMAGVDALDELPSITIESNHHLIGPSKDLLSVDHIQRGSFELVGTSNELNIRKGALVFWLAWSGRYAEALTVGEPYVRHSGAGADGMEDSLGDALAGLGHAYAALGRPDDALAAFAHARATYERIDHHFKIGNTAIYELSEAFLPYRADRVMERQWLADQAEAG